MYDVAIVGSGPAGANLARLIANKYKVLLLDKRDLGNENPKNLANKCCGGLLAPDAQKMIAKLGLWLPKDILVNPQLFAVRAIDLTNNMERLYQRFYFNMDREKFDRWLVSILPAGVDKKFNSFFKNFTEIPGGYEIRYVHDKQELSAKTRIIVGADGADSCLRKLIGKDRNVPETYISIQEWFTYPCHIPYFTAIFDEEISDFYSWIIPKENCLVLGSALRPEANAREKFAVLKAKLTRLGFHFDHKIKTEGAYIYRPRKASKFCAGRYGVALIGEAAGAISPSSAEGISYALKSSLYLAECLEEGIDGFMDRYKRKAMDIRLNLLMKNLKSPAMYHPFLRQLAMKSGLKSIR
ncbi:MAG: FAD-binding protein [Bacillota bacterium]